MSQPRHTKTKPGTLTKRNISLEEDMDKALRARAAKRNIGVTDLVRLYITRGLKHDEACENNPGFAPAEYRPMPGLVCQHDMNLLKLFGECTCPRECRCRGRICPHLLLLGEPHGR